MWEGRSLPETTSENFRLALVQPRLPCICEVTTVSVENNRTVRSKGSCRVYDKYRLKDVIEEHEIKTKHRASRIFTVRKDTTVV